MVRGSTEAGGTGARRRSSARRSAAASIGQVDQLRCPASLRPHETQALPRSAARRRRPGRSLVSGRPLSKESAEIVIEGLGGGGGQQDLSHRTGAWAVGATAGAREEERSSPSSWRLTRTGASTKKKSSAIQLEVTSSLLCDLGQRQAHASARLPGYRGPSAAALLGRSWRLQRHAASPAASLCVQPLWTTRSATKHARRRREL